MCYRTGFLCVVGCCLVVGQLAEAEAPVEFLRVRIGSVTYEAATAFDVNNDGVIDIVSGEYWFPGPAFTEQHKMCDLQAEQAYYDDFCDYPLDVNGDGFIDVVTGGWWGKTLRWRENPKGQTGPWTVHDVDECGPVETMRFWDVDGDGHVEACPNAGDKVAVYRLLRDEQGKPAGKFEKHVLKDSDAGHGLGFGDVNGDGRGDFVIPTGWLEGPEKPWEQPWPFHAEFDLGDTSIPVLVHDVNGDGRADLIEGQGHGYGLNWHEQQVDGDKRTWIKHEIDPNRSQYHDMQLADIDNDGQVELITGKRYHAHLGKDPGAEDPVGVYYFDIDGGKFERVTLDCGPAGHASGVGDYFWISDIDGNGWKDILAPGQEGLFLFKNQGRK